MKKLRMFITSALLLGSMALVVGCGNSSKEETLDVATIQKNLTESNVLTDKAIDTPAKEHWIFENVKDKIEDGFVSQAIINVRLQDVIVVKTTDVEATKKAIEEYKENSLRMFADGYGGDDNATAVADSKLESIGDVVYFIATPNVAEVENIILGK